MGTQETSMPRAVKPDSRAHISAPGVPARTRRRAFLASLGTAALMSRGTRAQGAMPVVGFLNPVSPDTYAFNANAFREGLAKTGFIEGRNVRIEYRWGKG